VSKEVREKNNGRRKEEIKSLLTSNGEKKAVNFRVFGE